MSAGVDLSELELRVTATEGMLTLDKYESKVKKAGSANTLMGEAMRSLNSEVMKQADKMRALQGVHDSALVGLGREQSALLEAARGHDALRRAANLAANEERRRHVLAIEAADFRRRVAADELRIAAQQEASLRRTTLQHIEALRMNEKFSASQNLVSTAASGTEQAFNRLRPGLQSLAAQVIGTNGPLTQLSGTLANMGIGSALTVGVLAAGAAIAGIYQLMTKESREATKAQDDASKSLQHWIDVQKQGAGGEFGSEVELATKKLEAQRHTLAALALQVASSQSATPGSSLPGVDEGVSFIGAGRSKLMQAEYNKQFAIVQQGEAHLQEILQNAAAENLAFLAKHDQLTAAQRAQAFILLKADQDKLAQLNKSAGNVFGENDASVAARRALIEQIDQLNSALNPVDPNAKKAAAALERLDERFGKASTAAQLALEHQTALNAAYGTGDAAIAEINAAIELKGQLAAIDAEFTGRQAAALRAWAIALDDAKRAAREQTAVEIEAHAHLQEWIAQKQREAALRQQERELTERATESWTKYAQAVNKALGSHASGVNITAPKESSLVEDLQKSLGIVQLIGVALDQAGHNFGKAIAEAATGFQSIVQGVQGLNKKGATTTEQLASTGSIVGGALAVFGAFKTHLEHTRDAAQQAAARQFQYNESLRAYADISRTLLDQQIATNAQKAQDILNQAGIHNVSITNAKDLTDFLNHLDNIGKAGGFVGGTIGKLSPALRGLADIMERNERVIKRRIAQELEGIGTSNDVRELRLKGLNIEADYLADITSVQDQFTAAIAKYGENAEVARQRTIGLAEAEKKRDDARAAEQQRLDRSLFGITNGAQALSDPRGAGDAAFAEEWRQRIEDAITPFEKAALSGAYALAQFDRAAQLALKDFTDTLTITARILNASGNARGGEDATRLANQVNETDAARRNLVSPFNVRLLEFAQFAENSLALMNRNIEDQTKILNEQAKRDLADVQLLVDATKAFQESENKRLDGLIAAEKVLGEASAKFYDGLLSAERDATKVRLAALDVQMESARTAQQYAQQQVQLAQQNVDATLRVVDGLKTFADSLKLGDLSTLSPTQKLAEARAQAEALASRGFAGDKVAASQVPAALQALLQQSRTVNASGVGFTEDFNRSQSIVDALQRQFGAQLGRDQSELGGATGAAAAAAGLLESLQAQRDVIQAASDKELTRLTELKDAAALNSQSIIDGLLKDKDTINANTTATLDKLDLVKKGITDKLQVDIDAMEAIERAAHSDRLLDTEWLSKLHFQQSAATAWLEQIAGHFAGTDQFSSVPFNPVQIVTAPNSAPTSGETQLIAQVASLTTAVDNLKAELLAIKANTANTANAAAAAGNQVATAVGGTTAAITQTNTSDRFRSSRGPVNS